jgi:hypothetical protein
MSANTLTEDGPNYDVQIDADELLADLAERAAEYGHEYEEKRELWQESLDTSDLWQQANYWMQEARGGQRAYSEAIAALQPEHHSVLVTTYRTDDGTVDVRGYMRWLSNLAEDAYERAGSSVSNPAANESETAYCKILSLLREEYGVGHPRFDDLGGVLEGDLP